MLLSNKWQSSCATYSTIDLKARVRKSWLVFGNPGVCVSVLSVFPNRYRSKSVEGMARNRVQEYKDEA